MKKNNKFKIINKIKGKLNVGNKKKRKRNKKKLWILFLGLVLGFLLSYIQKMYLQGFAIFNFTNDNFLQVILKIVQIIVIFVLGFIAHIIIHEAGHLIFGILSGYSFVSFRVGSFIIIKKNKKIKLKRYNIPGTAGQCLMMPPESIDGEFPFIMYNLGGVIINLIVSIVSILIVFNIEGLPSIVESILIISSIGGIIAGLTNGIPFKIGGIANDGYNIISMGKDEEARESFYLQLRVNGLQTEGIRIKDMPLEIFELKEGADLSSLLTTAVKLMEYTWYLDNMDLEMARKTINSFIPYFNKIIPLYQYEINCEIIFLELVGNCDKDFIDRLYNKSLKKYIKTAKFMLSKRRLLLAYEAYYNQDKEKMFEYYEELNQLAEMFPVKGEVDMELMIADWIIKDVGIE